MYLGLLVVVGELACHARNMVSLKMCEFKYVRILNEVGAYICTPHLLWKTVLGVMNSVACVRTYMLNIRVVKKNDGGS